MCDSYNFTILYQTLMESGGMKNTALVPRKAPTMPKPQWHPPWKLYRVSSICAVSAPQPQSNYILLLMACCRLVVFQVISGHLGWVRSIAVEPGNQWFVTGSADRTIKVHLAGLLLLHVRQCGLCTCVVLRLYCVSQIWDLASGKLKLSLTGHISTVRGVAVSTRSPYLFSCGEDKQVKCWDLEYNKVVKQREKTNIHICYR